MRALYTFYDEEARNGKSSVFFTKVRSAGIVFVAAHSGAPMVSVTVWPPDEKRLLLITLALKRSDFTFSYFFRFFYLVRRRHRYRPRGAQKVPL